MKMYSFTSNAEWEAVQIKLAWCPKAQEDPVSVELRNSVLICNIYTQTHSQFLRAYMLFYYIFCKIYIQLDCKKDNNPQSGWNLEVVMLRYVTSWGILGRWVHGRFPSRLHRARKGCLTLSCLAALLVCSYYLFIYKVSAPLFPFLNQFQFTVQKY